MLPIFTLFRAWFGKVALRAASKNEAVDFKLLTENSNDVIIRCDLDGRTKYASPSLMRLLGIRPEEMIGKSHLGYVLPEDLPAIEAERKQHAAGHAEGLATFRMVRKDGTIIWVEGSGRTVKDSATGSMDFVIVMRDVTEHKVLEAQLSALALTDGLTGLGNRRAFDEALENEWRRTKRSGKELSLLLLDLDRFKGFNDSYGHLAGDDCLRAVAATIGKTLRRAGDLAARYGGEEIGVILPETDSAGAVAIALELRAAVEALCIPHLKNIEGGQRVTVSIGAATALARAGVAVKMPAGLVQSADLALYKAKQNGRNRVETALLLTANQALRATDAA